jgi:hypothetical protein
MRLKLECLEDLKEATALASWLNRPSVREVVVLIPWLDADERERSAKALCRLFNDCGCAVATAAFAAAAGLVIILHPGSPGWSWASFGTAFVAGVAAGVVGKLAGLAWSRLRLRAWLRRMSKANSCECAATHEPAGS